MMAIQENLGKELYDEDLLNTIFDKLDTDKEGGIDFDEFLIGACDKSKLLTHENLEMVFKILDSNKTGKISEEDVSKVFIPKREKFRNEKDFNYDKGRISEVLATFAKKGEKGELSFDLFKYQMVALI